MPYRHHMHDDHVSKPTNQPPYPCTPCPPTSPWDQPRDPNLFCDLTMWVQAWTRVEFLSRCYTPKWPGCLNMYPMNVFCHLAPTLRQNPFSGYYYVATSLCKSDFSPQKLNPKMDRLHKQVSHECLLPLGTSIETKSFFRILLCGYQLEQEWFFSQKLYPQVARQHEQVVHGPLLPLGTNIEPNTFFRILLQRL